MSDAAGEPRRWRAPAWSSLAALCFGTLGPLTRFAEEAGVGALAIVAWRAAIGAASMLAAARGAARVGRRRPFSLHASRHASGGSCRRRSPTSSSTWRCSSPSSGSDGLALLVFYSYPAFVAVASVLWFGERLDRVRWTALGLSLVGLVLTLAGSGALGELDALGIGLAFLAGIAQAFYVLAAGMASPHPADRGGRRHHGRSRRSATW